MAEAHEIDHADDKVLRRCVDDPGWPYARAYVDALAASRACLEHVVDVGAQCGLKSAVIHQPMSLLICWRTTLYRLDESQVVKIRRCSLRVPWWNPGVIE
jgi:hypothetical protein